MADPRFFANHGPFALSRICEAVGVGLPAHADGATPVTDLDDLGNAGRTHLTFFSGAVGMRTAFQASQARVCLVPETGNTPDGPPGMLLLPVPSVSHAFAAVAALFYPDNSRPAWPGSPFVSPLAELGTDVLLAPGVVIGAGAQIGAGTRLGPHAVIGPGVAIGRDCEIGANTSISHAYLGDRVTVLPGARIGQPGFGFASGPRGHVKIPQLGRVIIQDDVEIGASTAIDRGALGDTVIGEGSKLDNLVMVGHNVHIGRHCVIAGQCGIAGSCEIGDFVVMGGQVGLGDHTRIGSGARFAARSGTASAAVLEGGRDYGGAPAKPVRDWIREIHTLAHLARHHKPGNS